MACGSIKQAAIKAAKSAVDSAKEAYKDGLNDLKSLNPGDFNTRQQFEDAKAAAIGSVQAQIDTYKSYLTALKAAGSAMNPIDLLKTEAIALAEDGINISMAGIIPLDPNTAPTLALSVAAKQLKEELLC
jgi:hypothetical protein